MKKGMETNLQRCLQLAERIYTNPMVAGLLRPETWGRICALAKIGERFSNTGSHAAAGQIKRRLTHCK